MSSSESGGTSLCSVWRMESASVENRLSMGQHESDPVYSIGCLRAHRRAAPFLEVHACPRRHPHRKMLLHQTLGTPAPKLPTALPTKCGDKFARLPSRIASTETRFSMVLPTGAGVVCPIPGGVAGLHNPNARTAAGA